MRLLLGIAILLLCALTVALWIASRRSTPEYTPPPAEGGWVEGVDGLYTLVRPSSSDPGIAAIGYAAGWEAAPERTGVLHHDPRLATSGHNLYCSGHAPEARLIAADGELLHRWHLPYARIPDAPALDGRHQDCWRRVRLRDDGSLLAIYGGRGMVAVNRDSRLLWHFPERVHHDLTLGPDGRVYTLTREQRLVPRLDSDQAVIDDFLVVLSPDGEPLERVSLLEALLDSSWANLVLSIADRGGDLLHVNSLQLLDDSEGERHPAFAAGNLLLCARDLDLLLVLDPRRRRVVWAREGPWHEPHDPRLLPSGRILLFDNLGASAATHGLASRLVELDPTTGKLTWTWTADPPNAFYSRFCGTATRLPGGNTLVSESGAGRAFELTPEGELAWVFVSPHRAGRRDELVAALFEVERIGEGRLGWLRR